ncbi:MAG: DNA repair protein RecO [Clostridia bacterium]|nr:DNA repair protein RecO [Clostridia bacterium]MBQ5716176.1 DNA repair protein RecO [Clostridia bacterium]
MRRRKKLKINLTGLVIKDTAIKGDDRLITLLTADHGVIRAFVKRARRLKGTSAAATQLLGYSQFSLFRNRDTYTVDEAEAIDIFFELRNDIERLSLAQYFCEICSVLGTEGSSAADELRLTLNCLHMLARNSTLPPIMIKVIFEMRMAAISGFMPELHGCLRCEDTEGEMFFNLNEGVIFCGKCAQNGCKPLPKGVLAALRHICSCPLERVFSFSLSDEGLRILSEITEQYLMAQVDHDFTALAFYKSLFEL